MAEATAASSVGSSLLAQLLTFRGRANRAKYWIVLCAAWPPIVWITVYSVRLMESGMTGVAMAMTIAIVLPAYIIMTLAAIRRLHDRDKRGHWLWLFWFGPIILQGAREAMMWPDRQEPNAAAMGPLSRWFSLSGASWRWASCAVHGVPTGSEPIRCRHQRVDDR